MPCECCFGGILDTTVDGSEVFLGNTWYSLSHIFYTPEV